MRLAALPFALAVLCATLPIEGHALAGQRRARPRQTRKAPAPPRLPCGDVVAFAVLMDRRGFSPGQIDTSATPNFRRALAAVRAARNITTAGDPDCDTWQALGGETAEPVITSYMVTEDDVNGPYDPEIPDQLPEQAKLPALEYRIATREDRRTISRFARAAPAIESWSDHRGRKRDQGTGGPTVRFRYQTGHRARCRRSEHRRLAR